MGGLILSPKLPIRNKTQNVKHVSLNLKFRYSPMMKTTVKNILTKQTKTSTAPIQFLIYMKMVFQNSNRI